MQLDAVTAGEAMVLFAAQQPGALEDVQSFTRATAGADLNVAIGLSRLGLQVGYISRLGNDSFGRYVAATLERERVDRRHLEIDHARATGFMLKSLSLDGSDPQIEYYRTGSAASKLGRSSSAREYCGGARHLHLTGICAAISESARELVFDLATHARSLGRSISFDPNLRPRLWPSQAVMIDCLNRLAAASDWVLPGLEEGRLLTGRDSPQAIADFYLERGASCVVVKLGTAGAYYASEQTRGHAAGIAVAQVVDTVGAGDGFAVGVISSLLEGLDLSAAAARGNAIGARVVQFPGDCDGLPRRNELDAFIAAARPGA